MHSKELLATSAGLTLATASLPAPGSAQAATILHTFTGDADTNTVGRYDAGSLNPTKANSYVNS